MVGGSSSFARVRPSYAELALAAATGMLVGVLIALAIGAASPPETQTVVQTVTTPQRDPSARPATIPDVVGERLDIATDRIRRERLIVKVEGGGILGVIREQNWGVVTQEPPAGKVTETGSTVQITIERR